MDTCEAAARCNTLLKLGRSRFARARFVLCEQTETITGTRNGKTPTLRLGFFEPGISRGGICRAGMTQRDRRAMVPPSTQAGGRASYDVGGTEHVGDVPRHINCATPLFHRRMPDKHKTVIGTAEFVRNDDGGDPLAQCSAKQKGARE
jgi:hypothetical protein